MDKLDMIFSLQKQLSGIITENETSTPTNSDMCIALAHEVMELHDELGWKWWKKHDIYTEVERNNRARAELADIIHFTVQIAHNLGMTPDDLFNEYKDKNMENRQRQVDGY